MLGIILGTTVCLSVKSDNVSWKTSNLLSRNRDPVEGMTLALLSETDHFDSREITWIIESVPETEYFRIKTFDTEEYLSTQVSDFYQKTLELDKLDNNKNHQHWKLSPGNSGGFLFESIAYPGLYLSKVPSFLSVPQEIVLTSPPHIKGEEGYILNEWNIIDIDRIFHNKYYLDPNEITPAIEFTNTRLDYLGNGEHIRKLANKTDEKGHIKAILSIPYNYQSNSNSWKLVMGLEHFGSFNNSSWSAIDIKLNGKVFLTEFNVAESSPVNHSFDIAFTEFNAEEEIVIEISVSDISSGDYWIKNISFNIEGYNQTHAHFITNSLQHPVYGLTYTETSSSEVLPIGKVFLVMKHKTSSCSIIFSIPEYLQTQQDGRVLISLNHCMSSKNGLIDITLNDNIFLKETSPFYDGDFGEQYFELPFQSLNVTGSNRLKITLSEKNHGNYFLSYASIICSTSMPEVNQNNYGGYVKDWIMTNRKNIQELNNIPRDDLGILDFLLNAPAWFYLPYLPASPTEIIIVIKHFPLQFIIAIIKIREINKQARSFRNDLLTTDIVKKNAYRHCYWTTLLTKEFGQAFAYALSNAHEYAHVDLTIEGPYDHVTDKINNLIGIELAKKTPASDIKKMIDRVWDASQLAWCKNFRIENGVQTADINWQLPLNYLASEFHTIPEFNEWELSTLSKYQIVLNNQVSPPHNEL